MKAVDFDDIDDHTLAVVRADMARAHGEVPVRQEQPAPIMLQDDEQHELPLFLRRQAS